MAEDYLVIMVPFASEYMCTCLILRSGLGEFHIMAFTNFFSFRILSSLKNV